MSATGQVTASGEAGSTQARITLDAGAVRYGSDDGLVPGVVQDVADGRVLMVAYLDPEALAATLETGFVHFHSRSRDQLWRKGESSGNVLSLRGIALDCDGDALLLSVEPTGPTCHRGTRSCFDPDAVGGGSGSDAIHAASDLAAAIVRRPDRGAGLRLARAPVDHDRGTGRDAAGWVVHGAAA